MQDWSEECKSIFSNLQKSIQEQSPSDFPPTFSTRPPSSTPDGIRSRHSFLSPRKQFLLLNVHCAKELNHIYCRKDIQFKHNIVYNTQIPYTIQYTPDTRTVSMIQEYKEMYIENT
jgi:hypothetical protein